MNRLKSSFLANMSHEVRTPLIGILGYSEILLEKSFDEDKQMVEVIHSSGKRLLETLNMILDLSRIESNKKEIKYQAVNVVEAVENCHKTFYALAVKKNLAFEVNIKHKNLSFYTDPVIFNSILNNLIGNAVKFTSQGFITLTADKETLDETSYVKISVSDTGIGISPENQKIIFSEFRQISEGYKRTYDGAGLGLTITKKFIELLDGKIFFESKLNSGSTFTVLLPLMQTNIYFEKRRENSNAASLPQLERMLDILVVDDEEISLSMMNYMLRNIGQVETATEGLTALQKASSVKFDMVFLDISMRDGISGIEILNELRKQPHYKNIPIIAFTAFAMKGDKKYFLSAGFDDYLSKPFTKKDLYKVVEKYAGSSKKLSE
jgi:CheY-like chemotaxis protein